MDPLGFHDVEEALYGRIVRQSPLRLRVDMLAIAAAEEAKRWIDAVPPAIKEG